MNTLVMTLAVIVLLVLIYRHFAYLLAYTMKTFAPATWERWKREAGFDDATFAKRKLAEKNESF